MALITSHGGFANTASLFVPTMSALSPSAWWRFGEAVGPIAFDEIASADGTYINTPTLGAPGLIVGDPNTAVALDGATQFMNFGSPTILNDIFFPPGGSAVIWINPTAVPPDETLFSKTNQVTAGYLLRLIDPSGGFFRLRLFVFYPGFNHGSWNSTNREVPTTGTTMIGLTWSNDVALDPLMYVNGISVPVTEIDTPIGAPPSDTGLDMLVGALTGPTLFFSGTQDECAVWKGTILTPAQMLSLYNASL